MDQDKIDWLAKLNGRVAQSEELQMINEKKDAILSKVSRDVLSVESQLYNDMNLKVSDGKNTQIVLNYGLRDQTTEFDIDEQQDGYTLISDEDTAKHLEGARIVTELSKQFDAKVEVIKRNKDGTPVLDNAGKPVKEMVDLFSTQEIGEDFYQPLVRQGLMPETFVPNEYSETHEMIEGSMAVYKERLERDVVKNKFMLLGKENLSLGMTTLSSTISWVGTGVKVNDAKTNQAEWFTDSSWIKDLAKGKPDQIMETVNFGWDIVNPSGGKLKDAYDDITSLGGSKVAPGRASKAPQVAQNVIAAVGSVLAQGLGSSDLQVTVSSTFMSSVKPGPVGVAFAKEELTNQDVETARDLLAQGIVDVMNSCDPGGNPTVATALSNAGNAVKLKFVAELKVDDVKTALVKEAYNKVMKYFIDAITTAAAEAASVADFDKVLEEDNLKKVNEKLGEQMAQDFLDESKRQDDEAEEELASIRNAENDKARAELIEKKIAKMKRHQKILKWSSGLAGMGFEVASKALAPLAIGGSAIKLVMNIKEAASRTRDLIVFYESEKDMFRAASPYSAPVDNFVSNAEIQMLHYQCVAAYELINMIGAIVETIGLASGIGAAIGVAVGKGMQAGAAAGLALEAVMYEIKKRYDLKQGWKTYKAALIRPENRKLALIAMKKNPTLAKYSVAWGAIVKKDPLVGDFMKKTGLTSDDLEIPEKKIDLVVEYLETRMPDDNVVVGREVIATDWQPAPIELTVACWSGTKRRGEKKADLIPKDTRDIDIALSNFEPLYKRLLTEYKPKENPVQKPVSTDVEKCQKLLGAIRPAFMSYKPRRTVSGGDVRHEQMVDVLKQFDAQVEAASKLLNEMLP